jgi:hypothetical protein
MCTIQLYYYELFGLPASHLKISMGKKGVLFFYFFNL